MTARGRAVDRNNMQGVLTKTNKVNINKYCPDKLVQIKKKKKKCTPHTDLGTKTQGEKPSRRGRKKSYGTQART